MSHKGEIRTILTKKKFGNPTSFIQCRDNSTMAIDFSATANKVAFDVFQQVIGPNVVVDHHEFKEHITRVCENTIWHKKKEKDGSPFIRRLWALLRKYGNKRYGGHSMMNYYKTHLLQFDKNYNLVNDGGLHSTTKYDWFYAITASPFKLTPSKQRIKMSGDFVVMEDDSLFDYRRILRRHGVSLLEMSMQTTDIISAEQREISPDLISVNSDLDDRVSQTSIPDLVDRILIDYNAAKSEYRDAELGLNEAKQKLLDHTNDDASEETIMSLFQTVQQLRAKTQLTQTNLTKEKIVMQEMEQRLKQQADRLSEHLIE